MLVLQAASQLQSTMPSVMKETVILSFLIVKLTLLTTVSSHQAVNPLTDDAASPHQHHHEQVKMKQKQQQMHQHEPVHQGQGTPQHGIDRNMVQDQQ